MLKKFFSCVIMIISASVYADCCKNPTCAPRTEPTACNQEAPKCDKETVAIAQAQEENTEVAQDIQI